MLTVIKNSLAVTILAIALIAIGCGTTEQVQTTDEVGELRSELEKKDQEIKGLQSSVSDKEKALGQLQKRLDEQKRAPVEREREVITEAPLLPPNAKPGECYARVFIPPTYSTRTEDLLKHQASERIEIVPAKYEWVEETVVVKEASKRLEEVPAQYEWVEEKILVEEAHKEWKKGRGPIEKVDNITGEIMCLVEVPATYRTVRKKVLVKPASVKEVEIPAEYKTVKVRKEVSPAKTKTIAIPAEYQTITKTEQVSDGKMEWRRILCETNMTRDMLRKVQLSLQRAGHDPGPIDGIFGPKTRAATRSYQTEKNLAVGELTYQTIESLGIKR